MYIDPFLAGIIATIMTEIIVTIVICIIAARKK